MNRQNRWVRIAIGLVVLGLLALLPNILGIGGALGPLTSVQAGSLALIFGLGILSVVIVTGYVGQISLCQATFMGVAAFGTAWLVNSGINYWIAAIVGVILSFCLGIIVGIPALRLRGILLAVVTLGVALSFDNYFFQDSAFGWFNGGLSGWAVDQVGFFGLTITAVDADKLRIAYFLLLAIFAVVSVLVINLHDSGSGRRFRAIRDSELAAATMGVDLTRYKLLGFGLSAAVAGIGGAFYPMVIGRVAFQPFSFFYSLQFAAFAVLMGIRFVPTAIIGGVFMAVIPTVLTKVLSPALGSLIGQPDLEIRYDWFNLVLGAILAVQIITAPEGVYGDAASRIGHALKARVGRRPLQPTKVVTS